MYLVCLVELGHFIEIANVIACVNQERLITIDNNVITILLYPAFNT